VRKVMLAGLLVVAVMATIAALGVNGTLTWFNSVESQIGTVTTATIKAQGTAGFPITMNNLLPSDPQSTTVKVKNTGTATADFHVQLVSDGAGMDFCNPSAVLDMKIENLSAGTTPYNGSICNLYPGHGASVIPRIADNVPAGVEHTFKITLHLSSSAGNAYQGGSNTDWVNLIAVQYNGPAPIPDNDGGFTQCAWPVDGPSSPCPTDDDDPNYP
jgi:hypothetical protein